MESGVGTTIISEAVQPNATDGQAAQPQLAERKHGGEPSMARVKQLLSEMFGPSPASWIQGLLAVRKGASPQDAKQAEQERNWRALEADRGDWRARAEAAEKELEQWRAGRTPSSDPEIRAAYQRGRADLQSEILFAERLAAIRVKYPDFDRSWGRVKPLVPRDVWAEMADHPDGLDGAYWLSKLPELCQELSELPPEKAVERFRHFVKDLTALKGTQ